VRPRRTELGCNREAAGSVDDGRPALRQGGGGLPAAPNW
jgi:hypothetical protein